MTEGEFYRILTNPWREIPAREIIDEAKKEFPKYEETEEEQNCDDGESLPYHSAIYRYVIEMEQWKKKWFGDST